MVRKLWVVGAIFSSLVMGLLMSYTAQAVGYGESTYGECEYETGCPKHTITTTPDGLRVAVNLSDEQVIPSDGYTIEITPLNGAGETLSYVEIFIDDELVETVEPDEDGTIRWFWDVEKYPGKSIKIITTDQSGAKTTQTFAVSIKKVSEKPKEEQNETNDTPIGSGSLDTPSTAQREKISKNPLAAWVNTLPAPVVYAFPYLLFIVLFVEMSLLLLVSRREAKELTTIRALITQEKNISSLKHDFVLLISHYLRTPMTLLTSGVDSLAREGIAATVLTTLKDLSARLSQTTEAIIAKNSKTEESDTAAAAILHENITKSHKWQRVIIWLPVIFVGILATSFVYLANNWTKYDVGVVGLFTQLAVFSALTVLIYFIWRSVHLRRQDKAYQEKLLISAQRIQEVRDNAIEETSNALNAFIGELVSSANAIPASSQSGKFVKEGISRLQAVQSKFQVATTLKGGRSTNPYTLTSVKDMYNIVSRSLAEQATAKNISISLSGDANIPTQDTVLTTLVLETILDNAIAYSTEGAAIEIGIKNDNDNLSIVVTDHGVGIPADKIDMLFQPFAKVEGAEVFNHEGMGFSLYLDKLIMTYLGGAIAVDSVPDTSTNATISFPDTQVTQAA